MCHKKKFKFEDYKHYLEATQLETKINQLKKKVEVDSFRKNHKKPIKKKKSILKELEARNIMYLLKKLTRLH